MMILNTKLITPRNVLVIGILSIVAHFVAAPLYRIVGNQAACSGDN